MLVAKTDSTMIHESSGVRFRISGHESFPCRYAWLPKSVRCLAQDSTLFSDEDRAMVELGVGKNMVRSIRFWLQATGVAEPGTRGQHSITDFGKALLGDRGHDPFLEDIRTLWLIHWRISTDMASPLLAWDSLLNRWHDPEIAQSRVVPFLLQEATRNNDHVSPTTVEQHFDTFLHTYVPTRGRKGEVLEDNLDCPLVELELIVRIGDRPTDTSSGRSEPAYAFRRDIKPDITPELFVYCLNDFWDKRHSKESTLPVREVAHGLGSPGQIFKLPEEDIRQRLEQLPQHTNDALDYVESANVPQVCRKKQLRSDRLLRNIYCADPRNG